ncbi:MAG: hypothetical protein ACYC3I_04165 [Gemmataceae bacterium]
MRLAELQQAVRAADPSAVLVSSSILDRVIKGQNQLSNLFGQVPHRKTYVVDRSTLYRYVDQDELELEPDRLLPNTVILLARPSPNTLNGLEREAILLTYWRRLFHASIHRALGERIQEGRLTAALLRERIERIGASTFAEIRMVLEQEKYLMPGDAPPFFPTARGGDKGGETSVYIEFAAVYLELRYFAANLLPIYFPGLSDRAVIEALLRHDVDAEALFAATRLAGAPQPVFQTDTSSDESHDYYRRLMDSAEKAQQEGNTVRSAILRTKAARVAPASLEDPTREKALDDLRRLTRRLQSALELSDGEAEEWLKDLPALLDKADQGSWPVEAALLYDLQKVGDDHERDIFALDIVTWLTSGGRRPIKRGLPSQRLVRITRHLRGAAQRLTQARLTDEERQHLAHLLQTALHHCEERLRKRFRPVLSNALLSVGLQPSNPPERTAFACMIEEMLDRIVELGFMTFSDLRDTISRNQLKMPDLRDPYEFARGDPLLSLDRYLATALDGVYRPGEVYLRWLERLTSPAFGTPIGRWLVMFVLLPFGGAAVLLQGCKLVVETEFVQELAAKRPLLESWSNSAFDPRSGIEILLEPKPRFPIAAAFSFLLLGSFLLALLHLRWFRELCKQTFLLMYRALHGVLIDVPLYAIHLPLVQQALKGWPFLLFWSGVFKPAMACLLLASIVPEAFVNRTSGFITYVLLCFVLNWRPVKAMGEALLQALADFYELLRAGLLPGMLRLLLWAFKRVTDGLEYLLHAVDEWLRYRQGDSQLSLVVRTAAAFLWYPVAWLLRFYLVVLVEPGFHPLKAPISILAAKFIYPILLPQMPELAKRLEPSLGPVLAYVIASLIAVPTVWLLPDVFGFLFWEMKENWRMYRANRQRLLRPVGVGPHGETVRQLLQPGFHSGTVPKLYARLREAEREAIRTGSWRTARTWRRSLAEVEQTIRRLVERELVKLLQESMRWKGQPVGVGKVMLTPTRIGIELVQAEAERAVRLEWEDQAGWLVASIREPGWLEALDNVQRQDVTTALAGLYKLVGIDLVAEQVRESLPTGTSFTLTERDLIVETGPLGEAAVRYDLTRPRGALRPRTLEGEPAANWPALEPRRLLFARMPLTWQQWIESWQSNPDGKSPPRLLSTSVHLLPAESPS